uniref:Uncharacterized protein n=1 Tax=Anguilla anguilla TaxID=7936 RepID=A0A0E9XQ49_ANGAN
MVSKPMTALKSVTAHLTGHVLLNICVVVVIANTGPGKSCLCLIVLKHDMQSFLGAKCSPFVLF